MFVESLLEYRDRTRRGWATFLSIALQAGIIAILVLMPMFSPELLPFHVSQTLLPPFVSAAEIHATTQTNASHTGHQVYQVPNARSPRFTYPTGKRSAEVQPPEGPYCPGCIPTTGAYGPNIMSLVQPDGFRPPLPQPPVMQKPPRVSLPSPAELLQRVRPEYPQIAVAAHQQGVVVLAALISREGRIEELHVLSGPPLLIPAAVKAVQQWRYRPYFLNGQPVEVETHITVEFKLQ